MTPGKALPPAGGETARKKTHFLILSVAVTAVLAIMFSSMILLILSISSYSLPWTGGNPDADTVTNQQGMSNQAAESEYTGTWQCRTPDGKGQVIMFTSDNRFRHWISDSEAMQVQNGSWRYDSSLYVYRLIYDRGDYSASVRITAESDGQPLAMHFEPLSSAHGMPLKGFDLEKVEIGATAQ